MSAGNGDVNGGSNGHSRSQSVVNLGSAFSGSPRKKKDISKSSIEKPVVIIPSIIEDVFGSSIGARTASLPTYSELGPPDLVHISRYNKQHQKEEGEYHFITGFDMSSHISVLGYVNTLNLNQPSASLKHPNIFTYCSYNAFSKEDVRIRVELPNEGDSIRYQVIPSHRNLKSSSEVKTETWEELFVSAAVRSIVTNIDIERKFPALVEKTLVQSTSGAKSLVTKLINFFERGSHLGANSTIQKPTIHENFLLDALYKVIQLTELYDFAINLLQNKKNSNLIIIKLLFLQDREIDAVKLLCSSIKEDPRNSLLLDQQVQFLISKNEPKLALKAALSSIKANPVSFQSWYYLVKAQILADEIGNALISLNSAPMYGIRPKDLLTFNPKDQVILPYPNHGKVASIWTDELIHVFGLNTENQIKFSSRFELEAADPALVRVNRQHLKGTHKIAYELLVLIINKVRWDGLLKARSDVFIMDEEYKNLSTLTLNSQLKPADLKQKRLCEKWLDDLFLFLYEDLRIVLIVENELANEKQLKHSALEWELIGLTAYRTAHLRNATASLRTTIGAKFDIISALKILEIWDTKYLDQESRVWNQFNQNDDIELTLDQLLEVVIKVISYNVRFFNEYQLDVLLFLKKFFTKFDIEYIKNKIQVLFENDNQDLKNSGVIPSFDRLTSEIQSLVSIA